MQKAVLQGDVQNSSALRSINLKVEVLTLFIPCFLIELNCSLVTPTNAPLIRVQLQSILRVAQTAFKIHISVAPTVMCILITVYENHIFNISCNNIVVQHELFCNLLFLEMFKFWCRAS